jgi:asparagine synthase (glutamine-hydrolysing)
MTEAVRHRGPDGAGYWRGPGAGLGVRRLAIIDPAGGQQPIGSEDGGVVVICNGEIYGADAQREALSARGHRFQTGSDVEVIVHLYEERGIECSPRCGECSRWLCGTLPRGAFSWRGTA